MSRASQNEVLQIPVTGNCMAPLLRQGQLISAVESRHYWPGDIVVFRYLNRGIQVHRFLGWVPGRAGLRAMTAADNASGIDALVPREQVLWKVTACRQRPVAASWLQRLRALSKYCWWVGRLSLRRIFKQILQLPRSWRAGSGSVNWSTPDNRGKLN